MFIPHNNYLIHKYFYEKGASMNYQKIYNNLMKKRQTVLLEDQYTESHHIIPKCLGGSNDKSNLVNLTPEEHFLAHQLLVKIYPEHKGLKYALYLMTISPSGKRNNNKLYGWIKRDYQSNRAKSSGFTGRSHKPETIAKMKEARAKQVFTEETKQKISSTKTGVKMTQEAKDSMNEKRRNHPTWLDSHRNKSVSEEAKAKISAANNGRIFPERTCPYCLKNGAGPNMTRYHFDNCKFKNHPRRLA